MQTRVCFIYPWATFGGVERVLLNRVLAFKHYLPEMSVDFYFLHDSGGLAPLKAAIDSIWAQRNYINLVSSIDRDYDLVFIIDCPQAIDCALDDPSDMWLSAIQLIRKTGAILPTWQILASG